ncbi:glyoxal oxidase N-terminus-domain-containing protein [Boletus coccyginus]|nr:glyoxal oxidase N-terminus-domain-containing protein [Boletus coccyginus]
MTCSGNSSKRCGGTNRLNLYNNKGSSGGTSTGGGTASGSGVPGTRSYAPCYVDNANGRVLGNELDSSTATVEGCIAYYSSSNFTLAGIECTCGNYLVNGAVQAPASGCNMACGESSTETCGGPNRLSVYTSTGNVTTFPAPTIQTTGLPGSWQYQGCLPEPGTGVRMFPYELDWTTNNAVDACLSQCTAYRYPAAGLEEAACGDISGVTASGGTFVANSDCNMACSGDPIHLCGGGNRLSTYYWTGTPLNVWNTPAKTYNHQFLISGLVVPLIATVGISNKVTFLEKYGTPEYVHSTGAYELDIGLVDSYQLAWREMHVKSDVFCSGSIILPDKGARQINVGGWSLESTYGVRLYYPDGSSGVNGMHGWEENVNELTLQRGRRYPTAMMMPNGSILVVGGETGSNANPQPSLEILPKPPGGDTVIALSYLQRTNPNSLYPFLLALPSGRFFIGYYNEARILDPVTFDTIKELPNMPGAVNNFLAGRTYPMEGSAMLLPQHAPYTNPIQTLICGGSTPGAGNALDSCISIAPEAVNPTWTLERMVRVFVVCKETHLPDSNGRSGIAIEESHAVHGHASGRVSQLTQGTSREAYKATYRTYMILNSAHQGVAGFGLATDPNYNAILYDPSKPVGQRLSILDNMIVARLYHSEATLLPDGHALVSGSDPQTPGYPEEMRVEVDVPPYLNQGFTQPTFTFAETDWALGGQYPITVTLFQGATSSCRQKFVARKARKYLAQENWLILPALELAYVFTAVAHAPRQVVLERMVPHVHQALEELGVLAMNIVNGDMNSGGGKNKKVSQKSHRKVRSKAEGREGYWDDLCLARFLEGVCWRFVAYPDPDAKLDADERVPVSVEAVQHKAETAFEEVFENRPKIELDHYIVYYAHFEYGRLLACSGDKEGAKVQFDMVLSGKSLEVNAAGRKGKYSLESVVVPDLIYLDLATFLGDFQSFSLLSLVHYRRRYIVAPDSPLGQGGSAKPALLFT